MKKKLITILAVVLLVLVPSVALADVAPGDVIISLGENLTEEQKNQILNEFGSPDDAQIIYISNDEEHKYLDGIVPTAQIGSRAISSVMVTYTEKGSGISVKANNINYITEQTYISSLVTAGVQDADIVITAPFEVSGTAALTGIMKAYEVSTGEEISDEVKKAANEEMITTTELGDEIGEENANDIINGVKKEIAEKKPESTEDVRDIIINVANNYNVQLSSEQIEKLVELFDRMKELDINWDQVANQVEKIAGKASKYLSTEEGQGFLQSIKKIFVTFMDWLSSLFQ